MFGLREGKRRENNKERESRKRGERKYFMCLDVGEREMRETW